MFLQILTQSEFISSNQAGEEDRTYCKDIRRSPVGVRSVRWDSSPEEWGGGNERWLAAAACTEQRCLHYCYLEKTENTQTQWENVNSVSILLLSNTETHVNTYAVNTVAQNYYWNE